MSQGVGDAVLGQGDEFARLLAAARELRLPHALTLEGAPGTGKTTAARALACILLGDDVATRKRVASRSHPDLHWLTVREDRKEIAVEDVRELQAALMQNAYASRARVAVIDPADRLNESSQSALLKTLEEPGAATFLLLATRRPEALLPTVRSRLARYRLRPLTPDLLARALGSARPQVAPAARAWACSVAAGALGFAQELVDDAAAAPVHARLVEFVAGRTQDPHALLEACLDGATGREAVLDRVRLVLRLLRAILRADVRTRAEQPVLVLASDGGGTYGGASLDRWIESCERAFEAEVDLQQHVAAEQTLLGLLLELGARP